LLFLLFLIPIFLLLLWLCWRSRQKKQKAAAVVDEEEDPAKYPAIERGYLQPLETGSTPHPSPSHTPAYAAIGAYEKDPMLESDAERYRRETADGHHPAATPWRLNSATGLQPKYPIDEPLAPAAWPPRPTNAIEDEIRAPSPKGSRSGYIASPAPAGPFDPPFPAFDPPSQVDSRPTPF